MNNQQNTYQPQQLGTIYHTSSGDIVVPCHEDSTQIFEFPPDWIVTNKHIIHTTYVLHIEYELDKIKVHYKNGIIVNIPDPHETIWPKIQKVLSRGG